MRDELSKEYGLDMTEMWLSSLYFIPIMYTKIRKLYKKLYLLELMKMIEEEYKKRTSDTLEDDIWKLLMR